MELAKRYNEQSADELVFLDITATNEKRDTILALASRLAKELFIPFTIGGGISNARKFFEREMKKEIRRKIKFELPKIVYGKEEDVALGACLLWKK